MARAFAHIGFTDNVKKIQTQMGSRLTYQSFEQGEVELVHLTEFERRFISERDSFYQSTINENGWPYVQHRGGPTGFLKVIDERTIGYADFSGNRQYLSVGNLLGDNRISLILMNYPERQRLKIWGRASLIDEAHDPEIIAQLESVDYRAPVERGVLITVEAYDWNCPKYITPRFTLDDIEQMYARRTHTLSTNDDKDRDEDSIDGTGDIPLSITAVRQLTKDVRTYELQHSEGNQLPDVRAGAHITVPVCLLDGTLSSRSYSLTHIDIANKKYQIAVKKEKEGEGGSEAIHALWHVGKKIRIDIPKNYFPLIQDERPVVLIAAGIGITPIMAMAAELMRNRRRFEIHYTAKYQDEMAFYDELKKQFGDLLHCYFTRETSANRLNLSMLMQASSVDSIFYICGPESLLKEAYSIADKMGRPRDQIQSESFR